MALGTPPSASGHVEPRLPGPLAARLRIVRQLAPDTWQVERRDEERPYVLKVLDVASAGESVTTEFARFKREQAELKALDHPGIVPYAGALSQGGRILLERLLVAGEPIEPGTPWDVRRAVAVARRVATILARAHSARVLHRGLKPGNVFVAERTGSVGFDPIVHVVDWCAARLGTPSQPLRPVDAGVDLWSLGVLLFEMLTGRRPAETDTPKTSSAADGMPRVLGRIVDRLLAPDPANRYRSATGLAFDLGELEAALAEEHTDPDFPLGTADLDPDTRTRTVFQGRERSFARLLRNLDRAAGGHGSLVLLAGETGIGKSRLASEVLGRAHRLGSFCLVGHADPRSSRVPYAPILDALDQLARQIQEMRETDRDRLLARLDRSVADLSGEILRLAPGLAPWLPEPVALPVLRPQRAAFRFREALGRLLGAVGQEGRPTALVLEDMQHSDVATLRLLEHLEIGTLEDAPLLVIATFDDSGEHERSRVRELMAGKQLEIGALDGEDARALAQAALGETWRAERSADSAEDVVARAGGNPGAILAHVIDLRARALGLGTPERLGIGADGAEALAPVAVVALSVVPLTAREIAQVAGVDEAVAERALGRGRRRGLVTRDTPARAPARHRFRARTEIRDTLLGAVGASRLRELGDALVKLLIAPQGESTDGLDCPILRQTVALVLASGHGDRDAIFAQGEQAARAALEVYAPEECLSLLALLSEHERGASLDEMEAGAQELLGRDQEALDAYQRGLDATSDAQERMAIEERIAGVHLRANRPVEAGEVLEKTFEDLSLRAPAAGLKSKADLSVQRVVQSLQRLNESHGLTSVPGRAQDMARTEVRLLERLATVLERHDPTRASASRLRALNLAARLGPSEPLARLLEGEADHWRVRGELARAAELARRALATREQDGSISGAACSHLVLGQALLAAGRIEEALAHLEESVRGFEDQGDLWGVSAGLEALGVAFAERGDWHRAIGLWERLQRLARRLAEDDGVTLALARLALAYARVGDRRRALELVVIEARKDAPAEVAGHRDLYVGQALVAIGRHTQGAELLERARLTLAQNEDDSGAATLELTEARIEAMLGQWGSQELSEPDPGLPDELGPLLESALEDSRQWPCLRARALRLEAQAIRAALPSDRSTDGGWWKAVSRSLEAARAVGARFDEATTLLEAAAGLEERGDARARGYRARAERLLEQGSPAGIPLSGKPATESRRIRPSRTTRVPTRKDGTQRLKLPTPMPSRVPEVLSEKRRWKGLLTLHQAISSILDPADLLDRVVELGLEVTGAQRGFLVLLEQEPAPTPNSLGPVPDSVPPERLAGGHMNLKVARLTGAAESKAHGFGGSRSIIRSVILTDQSVVRADARTDPTFGRQGSVASQHIRSVLAVPLRRGEILLGVLYVDNALVAGLIRERERELLEIFATQAAIAIDNAAAYTEIGALKEQLSSENVRLKEGLREATRGGTIVGKSPGLQKALDQVARVAPTGSTVLITGETGVGKEGFARSVHQLSSRSEGPLIKIDCAALPATLLESELFGHERGAFTGAERRRIGKFEMAERGTVFLDEIGNIPLDLQVKLLQVLESRTFFRLGGREAIEVDVRVVAATNRDLAVAVREGSFREDLFYRLNVVPIHIPPLRARPGDVQLLVEHFVQRFNRSLGRDVASISPETMERLVRYPWPGNIRELENLIERSLVLADGDELELVGLPTPAETITTPSSPIALMPFPDDALSLADGIRDYKIARIRSALRTAGGNRAEAARHLGIHRQNLSRLFKQLGFDPDDESGGTGSEE